MFKTINTMITQTFINGEFNILSTGGEFQPMRKHGSEPTGLRFEPPKTSPPSTKIPKPKTEARKRAINNWIATVVLKSGFCSLDAKFEADLNNRNISANLKAELDAKNFPLTASATVTEERTGKWTITDGNVIYTVYNEDERLIVYKCHNEAGLNVLSAVVKSILKQSTGDGVILFPAGMFYTEEKPASTFYNRVQETLMPVLKLLRHLWAPA